MKINILPRLISLSWRGLVAVILILATSAIVYAQPIKQTIKALYIPLADHYAALVAYERYRGEMIQTDFQITQMKNWDLLRSYYQSGKADMAYVMSPLAMDMYNEKPHFRWIGLMHRDGNALAINNLLNGDIRVAEYRKDRKPDEKVAIALAKIYQDTGRATEIGVPHILSTHTVVLYRYFKEYGLKLGLVPNEHTEVLAVTVAPAKSPAFIKGKSNRAQAAAFEQSLPWADVAETGGFGRIAWYSKDVMPWPHGHIECIALATNRAISEKFKAIKEVMHYIRLAGRDIEIARQEGGDALAKIVDIVRKHIPGHTRKAIIASLDPSLKVINYHHLNVDKAGLKQIMDLAIEGGILKKSIDIDAFADLRFSQPETQKPFIDVVAKLKK